MKIFDAHLKKSRRRKHKSGTGRYIRTITTGTAGSGHIHNVITSPCYSKQYAAGKNRFIYIALCRPTGCLCAALVQRKIREKRLFAGMRKQVAEREMRYEKIFMRLLSV